MRHLALALLLAGCTTVSDPPPAKCEVEPLRALIGQQATEDLGKEALRLSEARRLRWKPPGAIITMDFLPDRLNISLDDQHRVIGFDCG